MENLGRLYYGDLQKAIKHFTEKFGKPTHIYCNKGEYQETELERIDFNLPKQNFILKRDPD